MDRLLRRWLLGAVTAGIAIGSSLGCVAGPSSGARLGAMGSAAPSASTGPSPDAPSATSRSEAGPVDPADPRPPYVDPAAFTERAVMIPSGRWRLPGTLSVPRAGSGGASSPALLLLAGSGPLDRDASLGENHILRDLAWGLAARGIVVLRYDKRTLVYGDALADRAADLTLAEETIDDGLAAVAELRRQRGGFAPIYVLGHSQGGAAIPRLAQRDSTIRGFVVMAGPTRPLEDVLVSQLSYLSELDGELSPRERRLVAELQAQAARVKSLRPGQQVQNSQLPLGRGAAFWLDLAAHPPAELMRAERRPLLVLHADRDYQVTSEDFRGWQRILQDNHRAVFKRYPSLNHQFISGSGRSAPTEYTRPGHVAREVVEDIAAWLLEDAGQPIPPRSSAQSR